MAAGRRAACGADSNVARKRDVRGFAERQNRRWGCRGIMPLPGVWGREAPDTSAPCQMGEHGRRRAKPLRVQRRAGLEADLEAGLDAGLDAGARVASARARMVLA